MVSFLAVAGQTMSEREHVSMQVANAVVAYTVIAVGDWLDDLDAIVSMKFVECVGALITK